MPDNSSGGEDHLEQLRREMDTWLVDQTLDVAAEVYDPKRRNIHELDEDDMLDRFKTLLGFDVNWDQPPTDQPPTDQPPADPGPATPDE
ncbi:MAG: hypothetical protein QOG82_1462 [Actinomycetota bacterium]|jgi:hypothetical protein|nr:hypothetical protein [Actinomycetota bacterium]